MNVLVNSGIVEQRAVGPVKLYVLTERGSEIAQKVLGTSPQIPASDGGDRVWPTDLLAPAAAIVVMLLATVKFLITPEAPFTWLVGGAIASCALFVVLRIVNRPSKTSGK